MAVNKNEIVVRVKRRREWPWVLLGSRWSRQVKVAVLPELADLFLCHNVLRSPRSEKNAVIPVNSRSLARNKR
ncbi:MAG: hypothetical protein QOE41_745 [Mycobacterium sp.]|jgi:hypothetical protein|nr:hypothetical protein [Mycobacterium sp.]MDT5131434.1 hypothetical protein [Mycobacterium sp.]